MPTSMIRFAKVAALACLLLAGLNPAATYAFTGEDTDTFPDTLPHQLGQTWLQQNGTVYGAMPDIRGPIGGSTGYQETFTGGDYVVRNANQMISALNRAQYGEVVYVPGDAVINFSVQTEANSNFGLTVPAGVTLASNRGVNGS